MTTTRPRGQRRGQIRTEAHMDVGGRAHGPLAPEARPASLTATPGDAPPATTKPMDALIIQGGRPLSGRVAVSGAKNAALPVMATTLLTPCQHVLPNVPALHDTHSKAHLLGQPVARVEFTNHICRIDTTDVTSYEAPYDLVRTMRASIYVLGPLLARFGAARVSLPGACAWGPRPVNLHIEGLDAMSANLEIEHGYIVGNNAKLRGAHIRHETVSVGATAQIMMAATLAEGTTVIEGAAIEPDITVLGDVLVRCGARIEGLGTRTVTVQGVRSLTPIDTT